jgi:hypothetical protein
MISSIQSLLEKVVLGKKIVRQPGIHEGFWNTTIVGIHPCDLNYGCDSGFLITTDRKDGCTSFTVLSDQEIMFDS